MAEDQKEEKDQEEKKEEEKKNQSFAPKHNRWQTDNLKLRGFMNKRVNRQPFRHRGK